MERVKAAVAIAALALGGCAQVQQSQQSVTTAQQAATALRDQAVSNATRATLERTARPRLAGEEVSVRASGALPEVFTSSINYGTQGAQSISEVLEAIAQLSGVSIRASEIVQASAPGAAPSASGTGLTDRVSIEYSGTLRGLLDELAARNSASWRFVASSNSVEFFRFETRTLSIYLPPGAKTLSANISLQGVSGGGSGSSGAATAGNVSVTQDLTVNPWRSIMSGINSILSDAGQGGASSPAAAGPASSGAAGGSGGGGGGGSQELSAAGPAGRAAANPELGLITVTARPAAVERVAAYVSSINSRFAQNVMVDIKVYSLALDSQASAGFSLDLLYQRLNRYGVSVVGASPLAPATGTPSQLTLTSTTPGSRWNGSQAVVQALSQFGNVALQTQGQVLAVNGQPSPIQVANEINYLASSASTQTANVGTTTTLVPGTKVVGFTANFLPMILGDNRILLQYQLQLSQLTALTQVSSAGSLIQTPQISTQSLQQQAFVRDGQSIVLFGFDQTRDSIGSAASMSGASKAAHSERQMVVIVIQVNAGTKGDGHA